MLTALTSWQLVLRDTLVEVRYCASVTLLTSTSPGTSLCGILDFHQHWMFIEPMNLYDLTSSQLKRAAAIKEHIENLNKELAGILGVAAKSGAAPTIKPRTNASGKKSAAAKPAQLSVKSAAKAKKKVFSRATRAKLSAKLKAYWAAKKAGKK
jgi:hypothetical protein